MARILIVDDSPSQLLGIQRIVEKLGHETITATDGEATGMKWLLDKQNCLTVRSGEGYCRD